MVNIDQDVKYTIGAEDQTATAIASAKAGLEGLKNVSQSMTDQMRGHWETFKTNWLAVTAAIMAAMVTLKKAWDMAEVAASYNEQMQMLNGLAQRYGTTADAIVGKIREIGDGMISMATAAETSAGALAKGLNPDMLYGLAKAAIVLKDVMQTTADDAFKRLAEAMEMNKEKSLKLAVGVIDLKDRYGDMADKMTETEKQAALYGLIMEKVAVIQAQTGTSTKSVADEMETLKVTIKDLELTLGQGLMRAGAGAVAIFQSLAAAGNFALGAVAGFNASIAGLLATITFGDTSKAFKSLHDSLIAVADVAFKEAELQAGKAAASFKLFTATNAELQAATAKTTAATAGHTASIGEQETAAKAQDAALKVMMKSLDELSKVNARLGEEQLKMAKSGYTETLKAEGATIASLNVAMNSYLAVISQVYAARIEGEKQILEAKKNAGASAEEVMKTEAEILKLELKSSIERRGVWQQYYDTLKDLHAKAAEAIKTKENELIKLQDAAAQKRLEGINIMIGLQEKLAIAQGRAATDESIYILKLRAIEDERAAANKLSGEAQVSALEKVRGKYGELTNEVTTQGKYFSIENMKWVEGQNTVISKEEAIRIAMINVESVTKDILTAQNNLVAKKIEEINTVQTWKAVLESAMAAAKSEMAAYQAQIERLAATISAMDKVIAISVQDKASGPIAAIKAKLSELKDKNINITVNQKTVKTEVSESKLTSYSEEDTSYSAWMPSDSGKTGGWMPSDAGKTGGWMPSDAYSYASSYDLSPDVYAGYYPGANYGQHAKGNVFSRGNVIPFARGGIFSRPTFFPMARGMGVMGEAGPEAVMPLTRGADGKLGVRGGGSTITFAPGAIVINGANKSPEQLAREIARPLKEEFRRLTASGG